MSWNEKYTDAQIRVRTADRIRAENIISLTLLIIVALVVAGCASQQQQNAEKCQSYGLTPGSGGYNQCMDQLTFNDHLVAEQQQQALQQNNQRIQDQLMNISHPYGY